MTSIKLFALLLILATSTADAKMYRWVDASGKVHFSDKVPPEMSQKGHTSLNKNGIESAKTSSSEELKRQQEEEANKTKISSDMTDAKKAEAEQHREDELILSTYETRDELSDVFQEKLSKIEQGLGILNARDESLSVKLLHLREKYNKTKSETSRVSLAEKITVAQESLTKYKQAIKLSRTDKEVLMDQFRHTLIRFDQLTNASQ